MALSENLIQAAEQFGAALHDLPEVQAYLQAEAAVKADPELQRLKAEADRIYLEILRGERKDGDFDTRAVNEFYRLRERLANHPLVTRRDACLQTVKSLFEQAAASMSAILSVDYTELTK